MGLEIDHQFSVDECAPQVQKLIHAYRTESDFGHRRMLGVPRTEDIHDIAIRRTMWIYAEAAGEDEQRMRGGGETARDCR